MQEIRATACSESPDRQRFFFATSRRDDLVIPDWVHASRLAFETQVLDAAYPCYLGTSALRTKAIFYTYVEADGADHLPQTLQAFLNSPHEKPRDRRNLVALFEPSQRPLDHADYRAWFWRVLQGLSDVDPQPDKALPVTETQNPFWEFSFAGKLLFVVGGAPTYVTRRSRNLGPSMVMIFQPRQIFEGEANDPEVRDYIRRRALLWDGIESHPDLGVYGEAGNREWTQYFISDDDIPETRTCPLSPRGSR